MDTTWLTGPEWLAVLRIGLGLWWLESFRHKDKAAWFQRNAGIDWAKSVAEEHRFGWINSVFKRTAAPRPKLFSYVIVFSELAIGLGLVLGFLTPVAAIGGLLLNVVYFVLMIHDWAEQGQNWMMAVASVVVLGGHAWNEWSVDSALGLFGA